MGESRYIYTRNLVRKRVGKRPLGRTRSRWEYYVELVLGK
jgi:hypothetical protein